MPVAVLLSVLHAVWISEAGAYRFVYKEVDRDPALVGAGAVGLFGDCVSEFPCLVSSFPSSECSAQVYELREQPRPP